MMPLAGLLNWAPFQLDALGLVTLFGAREMNMSVGNLTRSWITDWLPIFGSYAVANNEIAQPEPGFVLYNVTDQVMATDVSIWFTRWLMSYPLTYTATTITLGSNTRPMSSIRKICSIMVGGLICGVLLMFAILTADWWGVANVIALGLTVLVRQQMVGSLRSSVDKGFQDARNNPGDDVKIFLTLPNGTAVTMRGPRQVVVNCVLTNPRPSNPTYYFILRTVGWGAFGAHAISLGMTALFNQILCVVTLLVCTYLTATHVGDERGAIGKKLWLEVDMGDTKWSRAPVYARLNMSNIEEDCMVRWSIMPQRTNTWWWNRYRKDYLAAKQKAPEGV
ncbi:hypothetical protein GGS26DRAFT_577266 [Hypomontagnella submonticulosa]|nr:hypothetical protein GGS26DRAFT_577266 [Hypomontagnella submonticulosa]